MPWNEIYQEAAYTSPSGVRRTFQYENVRRAFDKNTAEFTFPGADGTFVQDLGRSGYRFPMRLFFWGDDYDVQVELFEKGLSEAGVGVLDHPIYGTFNVVPIGRIIRRDDLVTRANQAIIEVTFLETIEVTLPASEVSAQSQVESKVAETTDKAAEQTGDDTSVEIPAEEVGFAQKLNSITSKIKDKMSVVSGFTDNVQKEFDAIVDSIENSVDVLVGDPIAMGYQIVALLQSPSRVISSFQAKFDAYGNLIDDLISSDLTPTLDSKAKNDLAITSVTLTGAMLGNVSSVLQSEFNTRVEALEAAENILLKMDEVTLWKDNNQTTLSTIDTGEMYQSLQETVALIAGFLVQISFTLKQERVLVTSRARTIVDLCAELYGNVDESIDFFISSNDFTGDELFEIPAGRRVVYYI